MTETENCETLAKTIGISEGSLRKIFGNAGAVLLEAIHKANRDDDVPNSYFGWGLKIKNQFSWQWTIPKVFYHLRQENLLKGNSINYDKVKEMIYA